MTKSSGLLKKNKIKWERDVGVFKAAPKAAASKPAAAPAPRKAIKEENSTDRTKRRRNAQDRNEPGSGAFKKMVSGMKAADAPATKKAAPASTFPARPETRSDNTLKTPNGMKEMKAKPEVKKAAKKTVKAAKKAVKAAVKTVKKAASGTPLKSKNTYTTSGTHAGGRKSSASRPIKKATSLKRARATSLRVQ